MPAVGTVLLQNYRRHESTALELAPNTHRHINLLSLKLSNPLRIEHLAHQTPKYPQLARTFRTKFPTTASIYIQDTKKSVAQSTVLPLK